jgi:adenine-specific DNA-methyltransferase
LASCGMSLGEYVEGKLYRGVLTGFNDAFVIPRSLRDELIKQHKSSKELLEPYLRGRDVKRWQVEYDELYLIKIESSSNKEHAWTGKPANRAEKIFAETYPAIYEHLMTHRKELIKRDDQGMYFWELRACKYWEEFEQVKIITPAIEKNTAFAVDEVGYYSNDKTSICVTPEPYFLAAILNSSVSWWIIQKTASAKQNAFYEFKPMYVTALPIPSAEDWQKEIIEKLVEYILFLTKEDAAQHKLIINYFEAIINGCVYELFLTEELRAAGKHFFDPLVMEFLPSLHDQPGEELQIISELFERLSARNHDIRRNLYFLNELESVRIIEGKE